MNKYETHFKYYLVIWAMLCKENSIYSTESEAFAWHLHKVPLSLSVDQP